MATQGKQIVWSTEKVNEAVEKLSNGFLLKKSDSPFHENYIGKRKANVIFSMLPEEEEEYIKCYLDVMYFAEKYCFVKSEDGKHKIIKLRPYQVEILKMYRDNKYSILMSSRQSGKTISTGIYILHFILFNNQKNVLVTADQWKTIYDILDKIKEIYLNLPYFLQKGIINWNLKALVLDNKSRIRTDIMAKASGVGSNVDLLYSDEFAIPDNKSQLKFYTSVFPTISSIENSKIMLTSTPRGINLFSDLLFDSERPVGDPKKNPYKSMRVYWWAVPSRFCTYIRLNMNKLHELSLTKEEIYEYIVSIYGVKREVNNKISGVEMKFDTEVNTNVIYAYNDEFCKEEDICQLDYKGIRLLEFSEITTWKKETIKAIGSEDAFNQEYGLQFVTSDRSLLSEKLIDDLTTNKRNFVFTDIDLFNRKLRFGWSDLKFIDDDSIFSLASRKKEKIIISLDISEGLGNDYTVINFFKISPKKKEWIDPYLETFDKLADFFCLEQIGMYRSNIISVAQLADLLYCICYDLFDPENIKIVLELNYGGPELLAYLPNVFEGNNNYGSNIFFRYKHRIDANEEKIGLKVTGTKNLMVRDYQDSLHRKDIIIYNEDNIRELTTFVKQETNAGNTTYRSDSGHDDTVMTVVNLTTAFKKSYYINMVEEVFRSSSKEFQSMVNESLKLIDKSAGTDYKTFINTARKIRAIKNNSYGNNWFNTKNN